MTELETLWHLADAILDKLDIPEQRRRDHHWILRNAAINNPDSPDLLALELCMLAINIFKP
jgi:hypothetical protein